MHDHDDYYHRVRICFEIVPLQRYNHNHDKAFHIQCRISYTKSAKVFLRQNLKVLVNQI